MPFKSQAQRRKFAELLVKGKISPEAAGARGESEAEKESGEEALTTASV